MQMQEKFISELLEECAARRRCKRLFRHRISKTGIGSPERCFGMDMWVVVASPVVDLLA